MNLRTLPQIFAERWRLCFQVHFKANRRSSGEWCWGYCNLGPLSSPLCSGSLLNSDEAPPHLPTSKPLVVLCSALCGPLVIPIFRQAHPRQDTLGAVVILETWLSNPCSTPGRRWWPVCNRWFLCMQDWVTDSKHDCAREPLFDARKWSQPWLSSLQKRRIKGLDFPQRKPSDLRAPMPQALGFFTLSVMTLLPRSAWHPEVQMSSVNTMESHHIITWAASLPNSLVIFYPRSPKICIRLSHVSFLQCHQRCLKVHAGHTTVTQCEGIALAAQP